MSSKYGFETTAEEVVRDLKSQIEGKVVLTTGVSPGGLGAFFVEQIAAANPKLLILAGRNASKVQETAQKILDSTKGAVQTRVLELDLGSLAKVRQAAAVVNAYPEPIDVLVNNAGIMAVPYSTTPEGFESQFGTNHLGPWLFTNLVLDKVLAAKQPRVVFVSSDGYRASGIRHHDPSFHQGQVYHKFRAYGQSKTANILSAVYLADKYGDRGLVAISLHPGVILTNLSNHLDVQKDFAELFAFDREIGAPQGDWTDFPFKTPTQGVATHVFAAFDPSLQESNGRYLEDVHLQDLDDMFPHAIGIREATKLWKLSEKLVGQTFD